VGRAPLWPALTWGVFAAAAPELAAASREVVERWGFLVLGTIRRDGTPRISLVEAHFVGDHLMLVVIAGTLKARDLLRDPRLVLNAPVLDAMKPEVELKLRGRAVEVADDALRRATADAVEARSGWRPPESWHVFSIAVDDVALIRWKGSVMDMTRWTSAGGVARTERDVVAGIS
jgi:hypothetical protein